jgi:carbamoyl-phosphate synthase large subunit
MKSTGEVMGVSPSFGNAFAKAQMSAGGSLPTSGTAFLSVNDFDKETVLPSARGLRALGFGIVATGGTAEFLRSRGVPAETVFKVNEGRPNVADEIVSGRIQLIINTPLGAESFFDEAAIRKTAILHGVPIITTLSGAAAAVEGIRSRRAERMSVWNLQEVHSWSRAGGAARGNARRR